MYTTYGLLHLTPTESIAKFLAVINPEGNIYHANFFSQSIRELQEAQRTARKQCFSRSTRWFEKIKARLDQSYSKALALHEQAHPGNLLPKTIVMREVNTGWVFEYQKGATLIGLLIPHFKHFAPSVQVKSPYPEKVTHFASQFDPEKKWQLYWRPAKTVRPVCTALSDIRNIRIPLGDIIDFLDKYR